MEEAVYYAGLGWAVDPYLSCRYDKILIKLQLTGTVITGK
jgi:hypothetical protein